MKKYINGKLYDTSTAKKLAEYEDSYKGQFDWYKEELYQKKSGEFFIYGEGHAASPYAQYSKAAGAWCAGEAIKPLTWEEARYWAETKLSVDEYDEIFGPIEEDTQRTTVTVSLPASTVDKAKREAAKRGDGMSAYIAHLIEADTKE